MQNVDIFLPLPTEQCVLLTCVLPYFSTLCTYFLNRYTVALSVSCNLCIRTEVQQIKLYILNLSTLKVGF